MVMDLQGEREKWVRRRKTKDEERRRGKEKGGR